MHIKESIQKLKHQLDNQKHIVKLRALPEHRKKIIFFTILGIAIVVIGFFEVLMTRNNLRKIGSSLKDMNIPQLDMRDVRLDMPSEESFGGAMDIDTSVSDNVSPENSRIIHERPLEEDAQLERE